MLNQSQDPDIRQQIHSVYERYGAQPNLVYMTLLDQIQDRDQSARRAAVTHLVDDQVRVIYMFGQLLEVQYVKRDTPTDLLYSIAESRFDIPDCDLFVKTSTGEYYSVPKGSKLDAILLPVPDTIQIRVEYARSDSHPTY